MICMALLVLMFIVWFFLVVKLESDGPHQLALSLLVGAPGLRLQDENSSRHQHAPNLSKQSPQGCIPTVKVHPLGHTAQGENDDCVGGVAVMENLTRGAIEDRPVTGQTVCEDAVHSALQHAREWMRSQLLAVLTCEPPQAGFVLKLSYTKVCLRCTVTRPARPHGRNQLSDQ